MPASYVNWYSMISFVVMLSPISLFCAIILERAGLRAGLILSASLSALGAIVRALVAIPLPFFDENRCIPNSFLFSARIESVL